VARSPVITQLDPQGLSNTFRQRAEIGFAQLPLREAACAASVARASGFEAQGIANAARGLATSEGCGGVLAHGLAGQARDVATTTAMATTDPRPSGGQGNFLGAAWPMWRLARQQDEEWEAFKSWSSR